MAGLFLPVIDQQSFLEVELAEFFNVVLVLSTGPVLWAGDSGFEFRDLIVEFSRWVLGPGASPQWTIELLAGLKGGNLLNHDGSITPSRCRRFSSR